MKAQRLADQYEKASRARSSRSQASANRVRIVEVASGLFRAHGIEAVSISDVMKAAGMTQGGFYKHFASKDALAAEACELAFTKAVGREELAPQITVTRIKNAFYRDFHSPKIIKTHIKNVRGLTKKDQTFASATFHTFLP
jgi:AcrR family transcriptional regulator